ICADSERDRQCAHERCQSCHDNWTKTFDAGLMNSFAPFVAFIEAMKGEVDNHDAVLFYETHEQEQSDHRIERQRAVKEPKCHESANYRREQSRQDGDRVHITLIENAEDYVHHEHCCDDQKRQRPEELLEDQTFTL